MSVHLRPPTNAKNRETARYIATPRAGCESLGIPVEDRSLRYLAPPRSSSPANDTAAVVAVQRAYARMNIRESPLGPGPRGSSNPQANGFFSPNTSPTGQPAVDPSVQVINGPVRKLKNGSIQQPVPLDDNTHPVLGIVKAAAPSSLTIPLPGQPAVNDPSIHIINGPVRKLQNGSIPQPIPPNVYTHPVLGIVMDEAPAVGSREHGRMIDLPPAWTVNQNSRALKIFLWNFFLVSVGLLVGVFLIFIIVVYYFRTHK